MTLSLRSLALVAAALCALSALGACTSDSDNFHHSSGTPVNPDTDPAGQGLPGSASTGANPQGTRGHQ